MCPELPEFEMRFISYDPNGVADYDIGTVATYVCEPDLILVEIAAF